MIGLFGAAGAIARIDGRWIDVYKDPVTEHQPTASTLRLGSGSNTMRTPKSSWSSFCAPESSHSTRYVLGPSWITPTLKGDSDGGARLLHTAACGSSVPRLLRNSKLTIPPRLCALQVAPIVLTS